MILASTMGPWGIGVCHERGKGLGSQSFWKRCCVGDEGWPFGVALRGEASNHLMLRWLKTVVVSDEEKAQINASGGDREGERERTADDVSRPIRWHQNRDTPLVPG